MPVAERALGVAALLMPIWLGPGFIPWAVWVPLAVGWLIAGWSLLHGASRLTAPLVVLLAAAQFLTPRGGDPVAALHLWYGLCLAVTHGRPRERALLLRTLATSVYLFAALVKLHPTWLTGAQLRNLAADGGSMLGVLLPDLGTTAIVGLAVVVLLTEAWIPVGLWIARTRRGTIWLGIGLHATLTVAAPTVPIEFVGAALLNLGLVSLYAAFQHPVPALTAERRRRRLQPT